MTRKPRIAIVGAGPGALPTIYGSGRISARLICKQFGKECGRKIHG